MVYNIEDMMSADDDKIIAELFRSASGKKQENVGFVNKNDTNPSYVSLFSFSIDHNDGKINVEPTSEGLTIFRQRMLNGYSDPEINAFISGSKTIPSVEFDLDLDGMKKLAEFSLIDNVDRESVREMFHIDKGHEYDRQEFAEYRVNEMLETLRAKSALTIGDHEKIKNELSSDGFILKNNILDFNGNDSGPLKRIGETYRFENGNIIPTVSSSGGPEEAFKHAAQEAMARSGIGKGNSRIYRMEDSYPAGFIRVNDDLNRSTLKASDLKEGLGGFSTEKSNLEARGLEVSFQQKSLISENGSSSHNSDAAMLRAVNTAMSEWNIKLSTDILTTSIFHKLIGANNIGPDNIRFNMDFADKNGPSYSLNVEKSFIPEFNTSDSKFESSGKAPSRITFDDIVNSSPEFKELNHENNKLLKNCFEKAVTIRNDMQKIISQEMVQEGTLKIEEALQFEEYMKYSQGAHPAFETVREQEFENNKKALFVSDNKQSFQQKLIEKNRNNDNELGL